MPRKAAPYMCGPAEHSPAHSSSSGSQECPEQWHSLQLPPQSQNFCPRSSQGEGGWDQVLLYNYPVLSHTNHPSKLSEPRAAPRRIRIPPDIDPFIGSWIHWLVDLASAGMSDPKAPSLVLFLHKTTSGIAQTEHSERQLRAEISCSLG